MIDPGIGRAIQEMLTVLSYVFLFGCVTGYIFATLLTLHQQKKNPTSKFYRLVVRIIFSILGGILAIALLFLWIKYEEEKFSKQRFAFTERMQQEYQILDLHYAAQSDQPFTLVFTIPHDGLYFLRIEGYLANEADTGFDSMDYKDIVVFRQERRIFTAGTQQYSFGFEKGLNTKDIQTLNFIIAVVPESPYEIIRARRGVFFSQEDVYEGIIYFSPKLRLFDCRLIHGLVTCTTLNSLRLPLQ